MVLVLILGALATVGVVLMFLAMFAILDDLATEVEDDEEEK